MSVAHLSVGIDYHQASLRVSMLSPEGKHIGSRNGENSVDAVVQYVLRHGTVKGVAVEACTGSAHFADELRQKTGWSVDMCHPGYVQRMRHNPDKSDATDSWLLSDLHRVGYLPTRSGLRRNICAICEQWFDFGIASQKGYETRN